METSKVKIICLTPVRNEAWILDRFLKATSLWADYIIIADQMSTDGSRNIALKYPKVILIDNNSKKFNEPERQKLLIEEARKIEGKRLLITLDADEIFSPNITYSAEWNTMINAKEGTIFKFQWANICSNFKEMWFGDYFAWALMDNNEDHFGNQIHSPRIPLPVNTNTIIINQIKVIHFQYTDWNRMESKHRWYQCYELLNKVNTPVNIYRRYHHMYNNSNYKYLPLPQNWINDYSKLGIDITSVKQEHLLWWDKEILDYFEQNGIFFFSKLDIWNIDWNNIAKKWNRIDTNIKDPRNYWDKVIFKILLKTQNKKANKAIIWMDRILNKIYK